MNRRRLNRLARGFLPPVVWSGLRWIKNDSGAFGPREWEYIPEGWARADSVNGWNVETVAKAEAARWDEYVATLTGTGPLGTTAGGTRLEEWDLANHNLWISHAYVLALAAEGRRQLSVLDWGGNLGYFYLAARTALPDVRIRYEVKEVPILCEYGRRLHQEVVFHEDESCLDEDYDLVIASGSFQYSVEWQADLEKLARAATPYLYITRLPVIFKQPSYVGVQRAYRYGYDTEYLGWFLNHGELLEAAAQANLTLVREFLVGPHPHVSRAPEQCEYRGYLFRVGRP